MNIQEFSRKHSVAFFWATIVLAVIVVVQCIFGFGQSGGNGGMPQGGEGMQQNADAGQQQGDMQQPGGVQAQGQDGSQQNGADSDGAGLPQQ